MKFPKFLFLISCFLFSIQIFAWGTTGHRIIAEIAERNLTPSAKGHLEKIIGKQKLAYWANWSDFIKSDTTDVWKPTGVWHYVNLHQQKNLKTFSDSLQAHPSPNLYTQIKILSTQIKNPNTSNIDKEIALRFLVHLAGDLAQPLHVGNFEDKGGNDIKLTFFGEPTNLHTVWDGKLLEMQKYSYTEYADVLLAKPDYDVASIQNGTLEAWFNDSNKMAGKIYRGTAANTNYSYDYNYKFHDLLERQLLYGGLRLAKILNDIL